MRRAPRCEDCRLRAIATSDALSWLSRRQSQRRAPRQFALDGFLRAQVHGGWRLAQAAWRALQVLCTLAFCSKQALRISHRSKANSFRWLPWPGLCTRLASEAVAVPSDCCHCERRTSGWQPRREWRVLLAASTIMTPPALYCSKTNAPIARSQRSAMRCWLSQLKRRLSCCMPLPC